jgi:hypothetical protein
MAAPTFGLAGTAAGSTTVASPAYPATVNADDIAVLIVETSNQPISAAAIGDGSWTQFASVGTGTAAAVDSIALQGFWRRCDGSEDGATVALPDSGDHTLGRIYTVVGCPTTGDPVHAVNTSFNNTASTAFNVAGFTTTVSDCLVMCAMGRGNDASGVTNFSAFANADLTSVSEPTSTEAGTTLGTGGGFGIGIGTKATAGTVGNFTATSVNSAKQANIQFALKSTTSTGGGSSGPVGMATATSTALPLAAVQVRAVGLATEADTSLSLARLQIRATGLSASANTALGLGGAAIRPVGLAAATNTALALAPLVPGTVGIATSANTALALGAVQVRAVGLASEISLAFGLGSARPVGMAVETDLALPLVASVIANEWFIREDAPPLVGPSQLAEPAPVAIAPAPPPPVSASIAAAPGSGAFVRMPPPAAIDLG